MKSIISLAVMYIALSTCTFAQTAELTLIGAAGDYFETETMSISWSLGEVLTEPFSTNDLYLSQGFQQGGYFTTGVIEKKSNEFMVDLYPNPASYEFKIDMVGYFNKSIDFQMQLFDISGHLVVSEKLFCEVSTFIIKELRSGTYFVRIVDNKKAIRKIFILEKVNY